jgi:predicted ester cyclase
MAQGSCPATTPAENLAIVNQYLDAVRAGDAQTVANFIAADFTHNLDRGGASYGDYNPAAMMGTAATFTIDDMFAGDDNVAVRYTVQVAGTNVAGAGNDGTTSDLHVISLLTIECGKIKELWVEMDVLSVLLEMGAQLDLPE